MIFVLHGKDNVSPLLTTRLYHHWGDAYDIES